MEFGMGVEETLISVVIFCHILKKEAGLESGRKFCTWGRGYPKIFPTFHFGGE